MGYFEKSPDEAETAFYAAFEHVDLDLMRAAWYNSDDAYCIHPGGPAHAGYETVLKHWAYIFRGSKPAHITYKRLHAFKRDDLAIHLVEESIGGSGDKTIVIATNTYIRTSQGWRILSHHASLPPSAETQPKQAPVVH